MRKELSRVIAAGGAMLLALGGGASAQTPELKIGFLAPMTGIYTQLGTDMVNGFQMYLNEHNGMIRESRTSTSPRPRSSFFRTRSIC